MQQASTILIVDDEPFGRKTLEALLSMYDYQLEFASDGPEALSQAAKLTPDLILLDVMMPGMDGFEVCRTLRADPVLSEVPVIMITALDDRESRIQGIEAGADDFISKPFDHTELRTRIRTITRLNRYRCLMNERARFERVIELSPDGLLIVADTSTILQANPAMLRLLGYRESSNKTVVGKSFMSLIATDYSDLCFTHFNHVIADSSHDVRFEMVMVNLDGTRFPVEVTGGHMVWNDTQAMQINVRDITERKYAEEQIRRSKEELTLSYDATLEGWVKALDLRDKETEGHSLRVTDMTMRMARAVGIDGDDLEHIRRGALLHDIGKLGIPDSILLKPGPLTDEEWVVMRKHPIYAYEWLSPIEYLRPSLVIPYCHHERWDGSGYPRRLQGTEIPLAARLFALADVWDALCSDRPYRSAWTEDKVRDHFRALSGKHFDPELVDIFLSLECSFEDDDAMYVNEMNRR
jgi:PAS domain S-box-containing protein/putative nucleotidyltransferase with HDIG domain